MEFNFEKGVYNLSLFRIYVDTDADFTKLSNVPPEHVSVYFHEYFHFLQDITTPFGFNVMWHEYDRMRELIGYVQAQKKDIELPLKKVSALAHLEADRSFMRLILQSQFPMVDGKPFMGKMNVMASTIRTKKMDGVEGSEQIEFVQLMLDDGKGHTTDYSFGAIAVIETMTYLIQKKFFSASDVADFPYMAAVRLAEYGYPVIGCNEEYVFALCEVALRSPYPGRTFYDLLEKMKQFHFEPKSAEEIYEFSLYLVERAWKTDENFAKYKERIEFNLKQLYGHAAFKENMEWHLNMVEAGYGMRKTDSMLLLRAYRQRRPFEEVMFSFLSKLGAPELMNNLSQRWLSMPDEMKHLEATVHPLFLSAFSQVQRTLLDGSTRCMLYDHCKGSEKKMPMDHHCFDSPWEKAKQKPLCPFAATWKSFGLDEYKVVPIHQELESFAVEFSEEEFNQLDFARYKNGVWVATGVGDYMARVDAAHGSHGQKHVHIARKKHTANKDKQVTWNEDGTRHDKMTFDENFNGMERAKSIVRDILGKPDLELQYYVNGGSIDGREESGAGIEINEFAFLDPESDGKEKVDIE
ncbi:MAG: hypothetical protein HYU70_00540 [Bacteroidetes bacterium]|nr:hypothetical protein [Bacteroidota bacterium]